ncbi:phosphatidylethanolamine-binding protein [Floricoccus tropicus]|uniref:Phosphatidylethanolamine-binding protein n=1 Tax=Floricoccus tropicus TaxID=1859473 RepID=A0A1E8GP67_9LACT|nr:YbhB/YbcL family Raf kinase inhibitor-like protein [Floricoccus tropicus]OFI50060.1 phosphatidylethanolamine-binding protein [Floricoccus tropicus]
MKIKTNFNDVIPEKYSKGAKGSDLLLGKTIRSFPFEILDLPEGTKSIAFTLIDYDAVPVCGFPWIHWLVTNVPKSQTEIPDNFSRTSDNKIEGKNSNVSRFLPEDLSAVENNYVGPYPPDKDHIYTLTVYALSEDLNLENGFYLNDFLKATEGKIIEETSHELIGRN